MFNILDSIGSTNNYAMAQVHAGLAKHGMAYFAHDQTAGKGQRGKTWETEAGQNIALSIAVQPGKPFFQNQFLFNAAVANACYDFFNAYAGPEVSIKWPNDIYWRDRKAGGILIENKLMGREWKWAVAGIGININQTAFSGQQRNAVSLKQICGRTNDPVQLARELHEKVLAAITNTREADLPILLQQYNEHLFLRGKTTRLKKGNSIFETTIKAVNASGQLVTQDTMEREFNFGEVEWVNER